MRWQLIQGVVDAHFVTKEVKRVEPKGKKKAPKKAAAPKPMILFSCKHCAHEFQKMSKQWSSVVYKWSKSGPQAVQNIV